MVAPTQLISPMIVLTLGLAVLKLVAGGKSGYELEANVISPTLSDPSAKSLTNWVAAFLAGVQEPLLASDPELDGVMIAWGYGIRPGAHIDRVSNTDVAPTLAELLGVSLPDTDGHVLKEILK